MRSPYVIDWASTYEAGLQALTDCKFDVYLLDYRLGKRSGIDLLREPVVSNCDAPIILLTGQGEREVDMEAMRAGAADYVQKDRISDSLERTIRYAIERHLDRGALRQLNEIHERRVEERTAELEKANESLREADRRKDEFIAILAHELRNPLAPIANSVALMKHAEDDPEIRREARETMERQIDHIVRLIDDLLEVSRISRGKIELRRAEIELAPVIHQAVETARPFIDGRRQILEVSLPDHPVFLFADATRLAQVVGNLLNNASKFTEEEGRISVTVEECEKEVQVSVKDNGIGIGEDQLSKIFELFTQLDSSLNRSQGGLGIGLTLVRNLVELHGGSVQGHSAGIGQGSEFIIRLPKQMAEATPVAADEPSPEPILKRRILIVDDNRDAADTLAILLRFDQHEIHCVYDGEAALLSAKNFRPDVVLLDIGLPKLNGYEVARRIRSEMRNNRPVLVAMTGWGGKEDRQRSHDAGCDFHLVKPVERSSLLKLLSHISNSPADSDTASSTPKT
jgi:signal transduction histidine kinase